MSVKIWRSVENGSNRVLNKTHLNKEQFKELNRLHSLLSNYIKTLGHQQRLGKWYKTENGYTVTKYCNAMKDCCCKSLWTLKVNVQPVKADIYFTKTCSHINL